MLGPPAPLARHRPAQECDGPSVQCRAGSPSRFEHPRVWVRTGGGDSAEAPCRPFPGFPSGARFPDMSVRVLPTGHSDTLQVEQMKAMRVRRMQKPARDQWGSFCLPGRTGQGRGPGEGPEGVTWWEPGVGLCGRIQRQGRLQPQLEMPPKASPPAPTSRWQASGERGPGVVAAASAPCTKQSSCGGSPSSERSVRVPLSVHAPQLRPEPHPASSFSSNADPESVPNTRPAGQFPSQSLPLGEPATPLQVSRCAPSVLRSRVPGPEWPVGGRKEGGRREWVNDE